MINSESFVLYESVYKHIKTLSERVSDTTALHYINCIMEFGLYGIMPPDDDEVWIYGFEQAMTSIYSAKERYNKSKENGRKGGAPERFTKEQVKELKNQGLTNQEVANTLGCSTKTVERKNQAIREEQKKTDITEYNLKDKEKYKDNNNPKDNDTKNDTQKTNSNARSKGNQKNNENELFSNYI